MIEEFISFCNEKGYYPENITTTEGVPGRFDHNKSKSMGYYFLDDFGNGKMSGTVGDWSSGRSYSWFSFKKSKLTIEEKKQLKESQKKNREKTAKILEQRHRQGRKYANEQWRFSTELFNEETLPTALKSHPYFKTKGITEGFERFNLGRIQTDQRNMFLVPIYDKDKKIMNVQMIHDNGFKQFPDKAPVKGGFHLFSRIQQGPNEMDKDYYPLSNRVYIAEGWATGEIINRVTRGVTYIAFTTSNLEHVGKLVRERHPGSQIVFCADNDQWPKSEKHTGPENPGIHYAKKAAGSITNSISIWPEFDKDDSRVSDQTDFNDLYQLGGIDPMKKVFLDSIKNSEKEKSDLMPMFIDDLMSEALEIIPIVHGIFNEEDSLIIHARGGSSKSSLSMQLALSIANGVPFLETFKVERPRNVLIVQAENSKAGLQYRLRKMMEAEPRFMENGKGVAFYRTKEGSAMARGTFSDVRGENEASFRDNLIFKISELKQEHDIKIEVMIIDPYVSFSDADENATNETRRTLDNITELCSDLGITPVLIHHDGKGGNYRGSSAIHDWCRSRIHMFQNQKLDKDGNPLGENDRFNVLLPPEAMIICHEKWNNGPLFGSVYLKKKNLMFFEPFRGYEGKQLGSQDKKEMTWEETRLRVCQVMALDCGGFVQTKRDLQVKYSEAMKWKSATSSESIINRSVRENYIRKNKNKKVQIFGEWVQVKGGYILSEKAIKMMSEKA